MRYAVLFLAIALALSAGQPAASAPVVGVSANTLPQGTFMLDTWFMWRDFTCEYRDDTGEWTGLRTLDEATQGTLAPRLLYGITDWLTIRVGVPLHDRLVDPAGDAGATTATGIGDLVIDPKIQVYRGETGTPRVAILAGVQIPTGDTESTPALSDGSTDWVGGAVVSHEVEGVTLHACLTHWVNGKREDGVDGKDVWVAYASIEDPLDENWSLLWEAKAYFGSEDSDYRRVYVCPGLSWNGEHLLVGVSGLVSVAHEGDPAVTPLDFDWAPYVRIYYRFF